jgi:hypothetical protein
MNSIMRRRGLLALLTGGALLLANSVFSEEHYLSYAGTATAKASNEFLYGERHELHYRDGAPAERIVLYTCRDGSAFARKTVTYVDPLAPDFLLEDASNGMREGVRSVGNGRAVFFRANSHVPEKALVLAGTRDLVADAGFDEFIRANWQKLVTGKSLTLPFLVPSRLDKVGFRVRHARSDRLDGILVEVFRLDVSGLLGWVAPAIDVFYDAQQHVLMRYAGISDLRDASGNNYQAEINFRAGDRAPSDEARVSAARRARLTACS